MAEDMSSESVSDSESESNAIIIKRAGVETVIGKYYEEGTKDGCSKYVRSWTVNEEPDKIYCVEIFRQFSNETQKRYWWIMGRVFNAESKQRISTSLLYCAKSSDATPPASGWKILRDGKKPAPKIKELKNNTSPRPPVKEKENKKAKKRDRKDSTGSTESEEAQSHMNLNQMPAGDRHYNDSKHFPYLSLGRTQGSPNQIRRFALDQLLQNHNNGGPAKTVMSEPARPSGMEENLLYEGSENLVSLLQENGDNVMMVLNSARDLKVRHSKCMKYLKALDRKAPNRKQFMKSMEEEKRMINQIIEHHTTLTRNGSYLSQIAQALQMHIRDTHRAKTHDGPLNNSPRQRTASSVQNHPQNYSQNMGPQLHPNQHHQQQQQHMSQMPISQAPPTMPSQVSHRSNPTVVNLQPRVMQQQHQHPQHQHMYRARTQTLQQIPMPQQYQQVIHRPQQLRPTITTAQGRQMMMPQHRPAMSIPMNAMNYVQQPTVIQAQPVQRLVHYQ